MKFKLSVSWSVLLLAAGQGIGAGLLRAADTAQTLPAVNDLPVQAALPDPFVLADGRRITTVAQWRQRRVEMEKVIEYYAIGHSPPPPGNVGGHELLSQTVLNGTVDCRLVHLSFGPDHKLGFDLALFIPARMADGKAPFPTIVQPVFSPIPGASNLTSNAWADAAQQYAKPLRRGYAVAAFYYQQCGEDSKHYRATGFFPAYPGYDWGDLAAWAWAMSRCVDYLETQPLVDKSKIIALGHSRLGKAALIAGAFDDRFALVAPAGSGCGGTGAYRFCGQGRGGKEGLADVVKRFPQWFGPRLPEFSGQVEKLPFDENWLIALVAPRCFIAADGLDDPYCNGNALTQSYLAAKSVYKFLDAAEHLGIHFRPGKHLLAPEDWQAILDFADQQLRKLPLKQRFDLNLESQETDLRPGLAFYDAQNVKLNGSRLLVAMRRLTRCALTDASVHDSTGGGHDGVEPKPDRQPAAEPPPGDLNLQE